MISLTNPQSFVLDIGANIGTHTIGIAPHVKRVMAFEPDSDNFDLLIKNFASSLCKNVTAVPIAASDVQGKVGTEFDYGKTRLTTSGEVPATPIDMIEGLPRIDFVKIDVEGNELKTIRGAEKTIKNSKPFVYFECADVHMENYDYGSGEIFDFFNNLNYDILDLDLNICTKEQLQEHTASNSSLYHNFIAKPK